MINNSFCSHDHQRNFLFDWHISFINYYTAISCILLVACWQTMCLSVIFHITDSLYIEQSIQLLGLQLNKFQMYSPLNKNFSKLFQLFQLFSVAVTILSYCSWKVKYEIIGNTLINCCSWLIWCIFHDILSMSKTLYCWHCSVVHSADLTLMI